MFEEPKKTIFNATKTPSKYSSNEEYLKAIANQLTIQPEDLSAITEDRSFKDIQSTVENIVTSKKKGIIQEILRWNSHISDNSILEREITLRYIALYINYNSLFNKIFEELKAKHQWKIIISMLKYDLIYNGWENRVINWNKIASHILLSIRNINSFEALLKVLPKERCKSKCKSIHRQANSYIFKWFNSLLIGKKEFSKNKTTYEEYRKLLKFSNVRENWKVIMNKPHIKAFYESVDNKIK